MTSFNHYVLGAVADWMHRTIGGMTAAAPGWRTIRFRPGFDTGVTAARTAHDTPYGRATIAWSRTEENIEVEVRVPNGADGLLEDPAGQIEALPSGLHRRTWQIEAIGT